MSNIMYASTTQPAAPKLSKVHFNILDLKNKIWSKKIWNFLCIFDVIFSSNQNSENHNFDN